MLLIIVALTNQGLLSACVSSSGRIALSSSEYGHARAADRKVSLKPLFGSCRDMGKLTGGWKSGRKKRKESLKLQALFHVWLLTILAMRYNISSDIYFLHNTCQDIVSLSNLTVTDMRSVFHSQFYGAERSPLLVIIKVTAPSMGSYNHCILDNGRAGGTEEEAKVRSFQEKHFTSL